MHDNPRENEAMIGVPAPPDWLTDDPPEFVRCLTCGEREEDCECTNNGESHNA